LLFEIFNRRLEANPGRVERIFSTPKFPHRLFGLPSPRIQRLQASFPRGKAVRDWTWLLTSIVGRDISVGIPTRYWLDVSGIEFRWEGEIFRTRPERPCGPPRFL